MVSFTEYNFIMLCESELEEILGLCFKIFSKVREI